ncbi:phospholipase D/nuclease [Mollisia scopiformis]|uniref:Phospholipase D/nuclease n=1 Tax=Mollisia scopiformis TaxID=149040 RepID=A0A194WUZ4_MOLSC|nr:phospholipase D/nuclease [Mollisia scopiformis]KUJ11780.1 phospholipase D/nuclease [Mollisia scopiformis]
MSDSESDEDLKRAIALSLQESHPLPNKSEQAVIDLISEDEDDDLDAPVKTKLTSSLPIANVPKHKAVGPSTLGLDAIDDAGASKLNKESSTMESSVRLEHSTEKVDPRHQAFGILGLNRKQMEEERLARLSALKGLDANDKVTDESRKRKAETSSQEHFEGRNVKTKVSPPGEAFMSNVVNTGLAHRIATASGSNQYSTAGTSSGIQYPDGIVKKTWAKGFPRTGDDITIEEVLQKDDLELAVLSAFQIDTDWIIGKLGKKTKAVWVLQAKSDAEKANWRDNAPREYRFCFPSMDGIVNCMHSKLQLLSHGSYLRIVIPSANLVPYDWGESGVMENVCFLIDLPKLPSGQTAELNTQFGIELSYFLTALGLDQKIVDSLRKFDFSRTAEIAFVHSIGGSHDTAWQRTGYCGLGTAVQKLGLATDKPLEIDFLAASIGSLSEEFIRCMYLACQGDDGLTEYQLRTGKSTRVKGQAETKRKPSDDILSRCRVYFPLEETVYRSKGGAGSGGTICFHEKFYNSGNFPTAIMRDSVSKRQGLLMHSKMIFIRGSTIALAYVGSANLSEAAWGKLVKDKKTKEPKLNCRNWECGVLLPVRGSTSARNPSDHENTRIPLGMEVFDGVVPVPMKTPGDAYGERKPWYFAQH